jgi:hypothetical protein
MGLKFFLALRARVLLLLHEGVVPRRRRRDDGLRSRHRVPHLYRFEDLGEDALLDPRQRRPPSKITAEVGAAPRGPHRLEPLMRPSMNSSRGLSPFPGTQVSLLAQAA